MRWPLSATATPYGGEVLLLGSNGVAQEIGQLVSDKSGNHENLGLKSPEAIMECPKIEAKSIDIPAFMCHP